MDSTPIWLLLTAVKLSNDLLVWLLTYAVHSTLLIGTGWVILSTPFGRRLAPANAAWFWRFALVGAMVSASIQSMRSPEPLAGTLRVPGTPGATAVRVDVMRSAPGTPLPPLNTEDPYLFRWERADLDNGVVSARLMTGSWQTFAMLGAWLAGAMLCLVMLVRARRRFSRMLSTRWSGKSTLAGGALHAVRSDARVTRRVVLTLSDRLTSPVALGRSEICLPARTLAELDPIRMESILAHELAHLEREDPRWLTLARVIEAVFFFQPLNRLARLRMQEAAEFASDEWAAGVVSRPLDLAHCLARVAEWSAGSSRLLAPAMAEHRGTVLVRRVQRLTSAQPPRAWGSPRGVRMAAAIGVFALVFVAPRAAIGREPSAPPPGRMFMIQLDSTSELRFERRRVAPEGRFGPADEDVILRLQQRGAAAARPRVGVRRRI